ncbi:MAG: hypothetical protein PHU08_01900 [Dehalococcoidales bacterium]|nr:hypothetical protein [Dehalococcoidales bacterium]
MMPGQAISGRIWKAEAVMWPAGYGKVTAALGTTKSLEDCSASHLLLDHIREQNGDWQKLPNFEAGDEDNLKAVRDFVGMLKKPIYPAWKRRSYEASVSQALTPAQNPQLVSPQSNVSATSSGEKADTDDLGKRVAILESYAVLKERD